MSKFKWLIFLIIFAVTSGLFFVAGFLTCYTIYPPQPSIASLKNVITPEQKNIKNSYAYRQNALKRDYSLLTQAEGRAIQQTEQVGKSIINQVLDRWSHKIRSMLGYIAGAAIIPFTTDFARTAVNSAPTLSAQSFQEQFSKKQENNSEVKLETPVKESFQYPDVVQDLHPRNHYTIYVQDYPISSDAVSIVEQLQSKQIDAYVDRIIVNNTSKYSVRVGHFSSFMKARSAADVLEKICGRPVRVIIVDKNEAPF